MIPAGFAEPYTFRDATLATNPNGANNATLMQPKMVSMQAMLKYDAASREVRLTADRDYKAGKYTHMMKLQYCVELVLTSCGYCLGVLHLLHVFQTILLLDPSPPPPFPKYTLRCLTYVVCWCS